MRLLLVFLAAIFSYANARQEWCHFKENYFAEFNLKNLTKTDGEFYTTENMTFIKQFEFNLCEYMPDTEYYARMIDINSDKETVIFKSEPKKKAYLDAYGAHISGNRGQGEVRGVMLTYDSDTICDESSQRKFQLSQVIECSSEYDKKGGGHLLKIEGETSCNPLIIIYHDTGCDHQFVSDYSWLTYWKPEIIGSVLLLMGLAMGWIGKKYFSYMAIAPIPAVMIHAVLFIGTAATNLHKELTVYLLTIVFLLVIAVLIVIFMRTKRFFPITITFLGCLYGFYLGDFIYALLERIGNLDSLEAAASISAVFLVVGGVIAFVYCRKSLMKLTILLALLASMLLIRGFSQFLGDWPVEIVTWSLMKNGMDPGYGNKIETVYLFLIILTSVFFFFWLNSYKLQHCDRQLQRYFEELPSSGSIKEDEKLNDSNKRSFYADMNSRRDRRNTERKSL